MAKLYKAVGRLNPKNGLMCWLVSEKGVAVSFYVGGDEREIKENIICENKFLYSAKRRFGDAIDPILIAEW